MLEGGSKFNLSITNKERIYHSKSLFEGKK